MAEREAMRARSARPAPHVSAAATVAEPLVERVLALQQRAGNRATGATLERRLARQVVTIGEVTIEGAPWTDEQSKAIQRELRRLRLYAKGVDGIIGRKTLAEAVRLLQSARS